jgi:alpha-tubulin suppressor-like RCC1 family protein
MATNFLINGSEFSDNFIPKDAFTSGGLWSWGNNTYGQLGDGTQSSRSSPAQITGNNWLIGQKSTGSNLGGSAIKTDGTLWTWGRGTEGQLGDGTTTNKSTPVQVAGTTWKQVAVGIFHTAAVKSDGTLWTMGQNQIGFNYGRLGDGTATTGRSSPVQTAVGGTNWKMVSCGYYHSTAIKTDGTLWVWGGGSNGQLGCGSTGDLKSTPVQTVAGGTNWRMVSAGDRCTMAVKTDNTLWTWGTGYLGGLGNGGTFDAGSPIQIAGNTWKFVSAGKYTGSAIKTDGTLWSWGDNYYGQIGDGTITNRSSPVQTLAAGTNWKQVSNGGGICAAIKTDGTLWTWGYNATGCLGDGTTTTKSSPIQTSAGGTNWKSVHCSSFAAYMVALRDDS